MLGGLILACESAPKADVGLELIVATDALSAPADFDHIRLEISQQDGARWAKLWDDEYLVPSSEAKLPAAFTLLAGQTAREVLISVTALQREQPVVQRLAQVQVPTDRLADLWLILARICKGTVTATGAEAEPQSTCQSGESCQPTGPSAGQCGSNVIVASTLPTYSPGQDFDAGPGISDATVTPGTPRAEGGDARDAMTFAGDATDSAGGRAPPEDATAEASTAESGAADGGPVDASFVATDSSLPDARLDGLPCTNACTDGATACASSGNAVTKCELQANGCTQWVTTTTCTGTTPFCNGAACGVCPDGTTRCSFNQVQTCAAGAWGSSVACPASTPSCAGGLCGQPPSCQATGDGMTNCGASSESCCASLEVTGGTFNRTYTNSGSGPTGQADPATVTGLRLDKYDVTVGRFRQFVGAWNGGSGFTPAAGSGKHTHLNGGQGLANSGSAGTYEPGWVVTDNGDIAPTASNLSDAVCDATSAHAYATWSPSAGNDERLPINCVNWFEAYAFCIWDGGFLPSEAEWEYAAAGGNQQREYPWGSTDPGTANQYAIYNCYYPNGSGTCAGVVNIAPVGTPTMGAGVWGQLDLAGNVWQWNLDWDANYTNPCTDCASLTAASYREVKGGLFSGTTTGFLPPNRYDDGPTTRLNNVGFRCARSP